MLVLLWGYVEIFFIVFKSDDRAFREPGTFDGGKKRSGIEIIKIQIPPKGSHMWHVGATQPSLLRTSGEAVLSGDISVSVQESEGNVHKRHGYSTPL